MNRNCEKDFPGNSFNTKEYIETMSKDADKPACKYGAKCFRKNSQHLEEYSHPEKADEAEPPRKKTKIDDFFCGKAKAGGDVARKEGETSGYNRETEEKASRDQSGYIREEELEPASAEAAPSESPPSPDDLRANIKSKFLVEMPEDFYDFWEFAKGINKSKPLEAFKSSLGLQLVGPYDILAGKHRTSANKSACYLRHWRYYYDPPEFLTIIKGDDKTQFHMGYLRDVPSEMPVFVASNAAKDSCVISPRGENVFAAILWFLEDKMKREKIKGGPLEKLKEELIEAAENGGYCLDQRSKAMKARDKNVVCKSFHGAGLVVPVDEDEVGYRPVPETPGDLKKMFKKIAEASSDEERNKAMDPLMEITMLVQFANDECDYGEGLELGMDLFCYGGDVFHKPVLNLLPLAYQLLGRMEFSQVIEAHLKDRKHSADLSVI